MSDIIKARRVAEADRLDFLPRYFTPRWMLRGESLVYSWMRRLSSDYQGGYWEFYELSNGGFYLALTGQEALRLSVEGNGFDGVVSADAAGIIATLFALNHLACETRSEGIIDLYDALRDFALEHSERASILHAID